VDQRDPSKGRHYQFRIEGKVVRKSGPIAKFVAVTLGVAAIVAGLFLSVFVFAGLLLVGVVAGGWIWWRTRGLRRQLKDTLKTAEERLAAARAAAERSSAAGGPSDPNARTTSGARGAGSSPGETIIDGDYIREKGEPDRK
jgi:hypothetical protein